MENSTFAGRWKKWRSNDKEIGIFFSKKYDSALSRHQALLQQAENVLKFAKKNNLDVTKLIKTLQKNTPWKDRREGQEHQVFLRVGTPKKVIKSTHPNTFGLYNSTPSEYLSRIDLINKIFPDANITIIGVAEVEKGKASIVTEMPFFNGKHPTLKELINGMKKLGFQPNGSGGFVNNDDRIVLHDAHTGNFLVGNDRTPIPIDLQIELLI